MSVGDVEPPDPPVVPPEPDPEPEPDPDPLPEPVPVPTPVAAGVTESSVRSSRCSAAASRQTAGRERRALTDMRARRALFLRALRAKESNHEVKRIVDHSGAVLAFAATRPFADGCEKSVQMHSSSNGISSSREVRSSGEGRIL